MKISRFGLLVTMLFFCEISLNAFDIKSMVTGMGTSFGAPPVGYTYSFDIWSDASVPLYVEQQGIASFFGAFFPSAKGYYGKKTLPSIFDAGGNTSQATSLGADYYFKLYVSDHATPHENPIYAQSLTTLPLEKHDPNVYYLHAFTGRAYAQGSTVHVPKIENMGYQNPNITGDDAGSVAKKGNVVISSQLSSLAFSNSSGIDVQVSLTYGKVPYVCTVEKYSYNTLDIPTPQKKSTASKNPVGTVSASDAETSDKTTDTPLPPEFSLRPNTLSFAKYDAGSKAYTPFRSLSLPNKGFDGTTYTIEIFQDKGKDLEIGIQGLTPGNYDQGITERVRDVTPCPCTFWYQSFEQGGSIEGYSDLPGQVWIVYPGADSLFQSKITPGKVISWNLIRPLLKQGDQFVYFLYVATTDDAVAKQFVTKVSQQVLGQNLIAEYKKSMQEAVVSASSEVSNNGLDIADNAPVTAISSLAADVQVATLMGELSVKNGVIEDLDQNVVGYLLGTDVFTPKGLGFGRFYYVLAPSLVSTGGIISLFSGYLDATKTSTLGASPEALQASLAVTITSWLKDYIKSPVDVQSKVEKYLIQYGNSKIVDTKAGVLTKFGQSRLKAFLSGNVSLKYPPMKLSAVTNQYVYDFGKAAPDKMPEAVTVV